MAHPSQYYDHEYSEINRYPDPLATDLTTVWHTEFGFVPATVETHHLPPPSNVAYPVNSEYQYPIEVDNEFAIPRTTGLDSPSGYFGQLDYTPDLHGAINEPFVPNLEPSADEQRLPRSSTTPSSTQDQLDESDIFEYYIKEEETKYGKTFCCLIADCTHETPRRIDAKRHYREKHANIKPYSCENNPELLRGFGAEFASGCKVVQGGCFRRFARKEHLKNHLKCLSVEQRRSRRELKKMGSAESRLS
ncbi:hypothetical protein BJ508DRAFT_375004 [Ascobolus immersus RN42]|uniref:Uncharacterized protein n=1 Tax=Ascobolus immersus RN42 TaxID=1160509 RepID=A0A3N4IBI6_ASCIM|nr:hypothetical protein BJ508DRAFT_375004 [Ascobolus immersus RN42]